MKEHVLCFLKLFIKQFLKKIFLTKILIDYKKEQRDNVRLFDYAIRWWDETRWIFPKQAHLT